MEYLGLLWTFFKIGMISYGGGWSIVGLIKAEVVPRWFDEAGFRSLLAVTQATPGPVALNAATLVGWRHSGLPGAVGAACAVIVFPVMAIIGAGIIGRYLKPNDSVRMALGESLKTGTLSMMLMTLWFLRPQSADPLFLAVGIAAFAIAAFTRLSPLWVILGAGAANTIVRAILG